MSPTNGGTQHLKITQQQKLANQKLYGERGQNSKVMRRPYLVVQGVCALFRGLLTGSSVAYVKITG
jgi:hypothetical protein